MASEKLNKLFSLLDKQPTDTFLLYGIGLEYKKLGDEKKAVEYLDRTIAVDANYCYAYFQKGQILEKSEDVAGARAAYNAGILAARRCGDAHAEGELSGALSMLEE